MGIYLPRLPTPFTRYLGSSVPRGLGAWELEPPPHRIGHTLTDIIYKGQGTKASPIRAMGLPPPPKKKKRKEKGPR